MSKTHELPSRRVRIADRQLHANKTPHCPVQLREANTPTTLTSTPPPTPKMHLPTLILAICTLAVAHAQSPVGGSSGGGDSGSSGGNNVDANSSGASSMTTTPTTTSTSSCKPIEAVRVAKF